MKVDPLEYADKGHKFRELNGEVWAGRARNIKGWGEGVVCFISLTLNWGSRGLVYACVVKFDPLECAESAKKGQNSRNGRATGWER